MGTERIDGSIANDSLAEHMAQHHASSSYKISDSTVQNYLKIIKTLKNYIRRQKINDEAKGSLGFAAAIRKKIEDGSISRRTARMYKAAVLFWLTDQAASIQSSGRSIEEHEKAYLEIKAIDTKLAAKKSERTSSRKAKKFTPESLRKIKGYTLKNPSSENAARALAFFKANLLIGLRPIEWFDASISHYLHRNPDGSYIKNKKGQMKTTVAIKVINAKTSFGRGNGQTRELLMEGITASELSNILHFMQIIQKFKESQRGANPEMTTAQIAKQFYSPIQRLIRERIFPTNGPDEDRPSLYSARHQVVANMKAANIPALQIAAFMGHRSQLTSKNHYGKKSSGSGGGGFTFRPSDESIEAVIESKLARSSTPVPHEDVRAMAEGWLSHES